MGYSLEITWSDGAKQLIGWNNHRSVIEQYKKENIADWKVVLNPSYKRIPKRRRIVKITWEQFLQKSK